MNDNNKDIQSIEVTTKKGRARIVPTIYNDWSVTFRPNATREYYLTNWPSRSITSAVSYALSTLHHDSWVELRDQKGT